MEKRENTKLLQVEHAGGGRSEGKKDGYAGQEQQDLGMRGIMHDEKLANSGNGGRKHGVTKILHGTEIDKRHGKKSREGTDRNMAAGKVT